MVKSPPFAPKYPSETTIIQINACRRSRLYISAMVTKVIRRILTDCVHFSNARSGTMAKRLAKDIQTTKASIRALTALIGSFLGSLDRTQAASVDRTTIIAKENAYAKPHPRLYGIMRGAQHKA